MKGLEDTDDRSFSTLANLVPHVSRQVSLRNLVSPPGNEAEGREVELSPRTGFRIGPRTGFRIGPRTGFRIGPQTSFRIGPRTGFRIGPQTGKR